MGNTAAVAKNSAPEPEAANNDAVFNDDNVDNSEPHSSCKKIIKIIYVGICVINILLSIAAIAVTVIAAINLRVFSTEQSSKLVAMILLAVLSAIALSATIYAMVAILRKQKKPVHAGSIGLLVLALIQIIILAVAMQTSEEEEVKLSKSLTASFQLSRTNDPRLVKVWAALQHDLQCCGVFSPRDYNPILPAGFAANVPISCCPSFDTSRSELMQERERQICKAKKEYYEIGCKDPMIDVYRKTNTTVVAIIAVFIIFEVTLSVIGLVLVKKKKEETKHVIVNPDSDVNVKIDTKMAK